MRFLHEAAFAPGEDDVDDFDGCGDSSYGSVARCVNATGASTGGVAQRFAQRFAQRRLSANARGDPREPSATRALAQLLAQRLRGDASAALREH